MSGTRLALKGCMEGIRILLLASSIGATMAGTLYAGVQAERTRAAQELVRAEALSPVPLLAVPELIPQIETLEPPVEAHAEAPGEAPLELGAAVPDLRELERLDELDVVNAAIAGVATQDIVLESGVRIGPMIPDPNVVAELAESAAQRSPRRRRAPARPPGPRLHSNPGQHTVLTARRMIASNELIRGSCYAYLSAVYERAGHRSWRKRTVVYRAEREGPYADLSLIRPGDWLYIVNDPGRTPVGTHSVMFTGWEDQARGYARTISHAGWGPPRAGRERGYDVSQTYRIIRPTH